MHLPLIIVETKINEHIVFHGCCMMICTGWRFHSGCSTSLPWLFISVFGTELQGTSPTAARQSPKFPTANNSVRPAVANWIFRCFAAAHLAQSAGFFQSPFRRFGTHCLIRCVIRLSSRNVVGGIWTWKRISLPSIRDMIKRIRGVTVSRNRAVLIEIYLTTWLLRLCFSYSSGGPKYRHGIYV